LTWFGQFTVGGFYAYPGVSESLAQEIAAAARHGTIFNQNLRWPPAPFVKGQEPVGPLEYTFT